MQIIFDMRYLLLRKFYEFEIFLFNNDLMKFIDSINNIIIFIIYL